MQRGFGFCIWLILLTRPISTGSDPSLKECTEQLEFGVDYPVDLDLPEQRAALLSLFDSTGGPYWSYTELFTDDIHDVFFALIQDLVDYGDYLTGSVNANVTDLLNDSMLDGLTMLPALSANCTFQQALNFGVFLYKHNWGEEGRSYCQWHGITCCKSLADRYSEYCTAPQSVAQIYLPDMNMSGSIQGDVFGSLPDVQSLVLSDNPDLVGRLPDFTKASAAKLVELRMSNTSLQQCDATHLTVFGPGLKSTVLEAGSSDKLAPDDVTECLPQFLVFCDKDEEEDSPLYCPSVSFRRPAQEPLIHVDRLGAMINVLLATNSLPAAVANITAAPAELTWPSSSSGCDYNSSFSADHGLGPDDVHIDYDNYFFSYVGCRCAPGYDNFYIFDNKGHVSMDCRPSKQKHLSAVGPVLGGAAFLVLLLLAMQWPRLMAEMAQMRINRVKHGNAPGTISADLAQDLGLKHKEITLAMTDVQSSSKLWEWNSAVMDRALAMHDACLRSVLQRHHGYEVATEGDAFTMAFHDPLDAVSWALEVQHRLLLLDWPAELLSQPDAALQCCLDQQMNDIVMFKGLRVRIAMHCGRPDAVQAHNVTRQIEYRGDMVSLTEALVGFPAGGQILLSDAMYQRVYGRLHTANFVDPRPAFKPNHSAGALALPSRQPSTVPHVQPDFAHHAPTLATGFHTGGNPLTSVPAQDNQSQSANCSPDSALLQQDGSLASLSNEPGLQTSLQTQPSSSDQPVSYAQSSSTMQAQLSISADSRVHPLSCLRSPSRQYSRALSATLSTQPQHLTKGASLQSSLSCGRSPELRSAYAPEQDGHDGIGLATQASAIMPILPTSSSLSIQKLLSGDISGPFEGSWTPATRRQIHPAPSRRASFAPGGKAKQGSCFWGHMQSFWRMMLSAVHSVLRCFAKQKSQAERPLWGRLRPLPTERSMALQSRDERGRAVCDLADMGTFYLADFADKQCCPLEGQAVHGGIHIMQIIAPSMLMRVLHFPHLSSTFQIAPGLRDAPGVQATCEELFQKPASLVATIVFCGPAHLKELVQHDADLAKRALLQFQSCVRTTLLVSNGYECQEKDGLFMIAFTSPRGAIEWALMLQLALLRVAWPLELEQHPVTAEVKSSQGQTLFKGLAAKVALVHGPLEKVCPHASTGRADYFGSNVNRAARLLCAAKPGQVLVEAPVMETVLKQWIEIPMRISFEADTCNSDLPVSAEAASPHGQGTQSIHHIGSLRHRSASDVLQRGHSNMLSTSATDLASVGNNNSVAAASCQIAALPNSLDSVSKPSAPDTRAAEPALLSSALHELPATALPSPAPQGLPATVTTSSSPANCRPPATALPSWHSLKQGGQCEEGGLAGGPAGAADTPLLDRLSIEHKLSARKSADGFGYTDSELQTLEVPDSSCQPFAADSPLAVSNCHMLKFFAGLGHQNPRKDYGLTRLGSDTTSRTDTGQTVGSPSRPAGPAGPALRRTESSLWSGITPPVTSCGQACDAAATTTSQTDMGSKPIWTPRSARGKHFPWCKVPVEVWGIGAFKFKGIAGQSKVMEVQVADLAERMSLHSNTLEPGKAVCVLAAQYRRCSLSIHLMDVLDLQLSL